MRNIFWARKRTFNVKIHILPFLTPKYYFFLMDQPELFWRTKDLSFKLSLTSLFSLWPEAISVINAFLGPKTHIWAWIQSNLNTLVFGIGIMSWHPILTHGLLLNKTTENYVTIIFIYIYSIFIIRLCLGGDRPFDGSVQSVGQSI